MSLCKEKFAVIVNVNAKTLKSFSWNLCKKEKLFK